MMKIAQMLREYLFDVSPTIDSGNGLTTRSISSDFNQSQQIIDYKGNHYYPTEGIGYPTITRLRQADGTVKYRVHRRLPTIHRDRSGRTIAENFSVVVDSPYKAMRLAKGNIAFDPETKRILDSVQTSMSGVLGRTIDKPKKFGLLVTKPGVSSGVKRVTRLDIQEQAPKIIKKSPILSTLFKGKNKLILGGVASVPLAGALYAGIREKRKSTIKDKIMNLFK